LRRPLYKLYAATGDGPDARVNGLPQGQKDQAFALPMRREQKSAGLDFEGVRVYNRAP